MIGIIIIGGKQVKAGSVSPFTPTPLTVGQLEIITNGWRTTSNGRERWIELSGKYRGSIEIIEWKDLINDARARNRGFIEAVGLSAAAPG
jgi:hypothetical protein